MLIVVCVTAPPESEGPANFSGKTVTLLGSCGCLEDRNSSSRVCRCKEVAQWVSYQAANGAPAALFEGDARADIAAQKFSGELARLHRAAVAAAIADLSEPRLCEETRFSHCYMVLQRSQNLSASASSARAINGTGATLKPAN